jgi:capsular polysaccharide biosynthesis protein
MLNIRKQTQYEEPNLINENYIGITIIYKNKHGKHEEFIDSLTINNYRIRQFLVGIKDEEIVDKIIENFNKTLKPHEIKREVLVKFKTYKSKFYKKI